MLSSTKMDQLQALKASKQADAAILAATAAGGMQSNDPPPGEAADESVAAYAAQQAALAQIRQESGASKEQKPDDDAVVMMPDGRRLYAVYVLLETQQHSLLLLDARRRTVQLPFVNNALFVYERWQFDAIQENMLENPAYGRIMMRVTQREAEQIVRLQAEAQKSVATSGPMSTPLTRMKELLIGTTLGAAKTDIAAGLRIGSR